MNSCSSTWDAAHLNMLKHNSDCVNVKGIWDENMMANTNTIENSLLVNNDEVGRTKTTRSSHSQRMNSSVFD